MLSRLARGSGWRAAAAASVQAAAAGRRGMATIEVRACYYCPCCGRLACPCGGAVQGWRGGRLQWVRDVLVDWAG